MKCKFANPKFKRSLSKEERRELFNITSNMMLKKYGSCKLANRVKEKAESDGEYE